MRVVAGLAAGADPGHQADDVIHRERALRAQGGQFMSRWQHFIPARDHRHSWTLSTSRSYVSAPPKGHRLRADQIAA